MAWTLAFDYNACGNRLQEVISELRDKMLEMFYQESTEGMSSSAINDIQKGKEQTLEIFNGWIRFYAKPIMESFGTGSLMDISSPYLQDYKDSGMWNPVRQSTFIAGRAKGRYLNIFGEAKKSKGNFSGRNLENIKFKRGQLIKPKQGTNSIKNAENWLLANQSKYTRLIDLTLTNFFENEFDNFFKAIEI